MYRFRLNVPVLPDTPVGTVLEFTAEVRTSDLVSRGADNVVDSVRWSALNYAGTSSVTVGIPEPAGDLDGDGSTDLTDYAGFTTCLGDPCADAPCEPPLYGDLCCTAFDADSDGDVDLHDVAAFQSAFTGGR
jgi:hypothetical protein